MRHDRLERLRAIARRHGAGAAVGHVLDRLARQVMTLDGSRLVLLEVESLEPAPPADEEYAFTFLNEAQVRNYAADPRNCLDVTLTQPMAAGGDLCFAALAGDRLAAYGWYALGTVDPRHCGGMTLSLPAEMAYFYNGFTQSEFRGRQLYVRLMGLGLQALAERGIRKVLASVAWTNWAALKSCRRRGCIDLGPVVGLGRGRWKLLFPPRSARRQGIGFRIGP
jgi:hypothetical protein